MSIVRLQRVSFAYTGARDVLVDVDLSLDRGIVGVVGENGGGKTTLLRLIAGELLPCAGELNAAVPPAARHLCPQRVDEVSDAMAEFADSWERQALRWKSRLGLQHVELHELGRLSPGERKRFQIAAALSRHPDILLLDEPTNHLDADGRALLMEAVRGFGGLCVIVSHDRELLDTLCATTVRIEAGTATSLELPYTRARAVWHSEQQALRRDHARTAAELRRVQRNLSRLRDSRARAERSIAASTRIKGPKDSDARSVNARGRAAAGEVALARRLRATASRVDRQRDALARRSVKKQRGGGRIQFQGRPDSRRRLAHFDGDLRVGSRVLAADLALDIGPKTRVHIRGPNGAGKTTLLLELIASVHLDPHSYLYLPQVLGDADEQATRAAVIDASPGERGRVLSVAAVLGLAPERVLASRSYSPGELRKLMVAMALARDACLLVLDEPTNHLDLPSVEQMEAALLEFPGALVVVTHDERFARALELEPWEVGRGALGTENKERRAP